MLVVGSGDWWAGKKGGDGDQGEWLWRGVARWMCGGFEWRGVRGRGWDGKIERCRMDVR